MRPAPRILLLLALALAGVLAAGPGASGPRADAAGAIRTWIWHFDPRIAEACAPTWDDLRAALPADASILVAVPSAREFGHARALLHGDGAPDPRLTLFDAGGSLSLWARDPYLVFARGDELCVAVPGGDPVARGREGDRAVVAHLAGLEPALRRLDTPLALEGGNVLLLRERVLVGAHAIDRNARLLGLGPAAVTAALADLFGRAVVPVGTTLASPPHDHLDMFLAAVDEERVLLAHPEASAPYFERLADLGLEAGRLGDALTFPGPPDVEPYRRLAAELREAGFVVERLPLLVADDGGLVTWTNAVMEERGADRVAYVPAYGIPVLDRAAHDTWRRAGFEVVPIRARGIIAEGGAVRCVTNALHRVETR